MKASKSKILFIAMACHTVNAALCRAFGDNSQPAFNDAPKWQVDSAVKGVTLHLNNPDLPPSASHESWLAEKQADNWSYGEVKDPERKLHPCMVPFEALPPEQQAKDFVFKAVVESLADIDIPDNEPSLSKCSGAIDAAEKACYDYAVSLPVGDERTKAFEVYENIRRSRFV